VHPTEQICLWQEIFLCVIFAHVLPNCCSCYNNNNNKKKKKKKNNAILSLFTCWAQQSMINNAAADDNHLLPQCSVTTSSIHVYFIFRLVLQRRRQYWGHIASLIGWLMNDRRQRRQDLNPSIGRVIAQALSRRFPIVAARVRSQARSCGVCGWQSGTGAGVLQELKNSLPILIPPTARHAYIIRGWYNRPLGGRRTKRTQSHPTVDSNPTQGMEV
jgi:hypothetical protein